MKKNKKILFYIIAAGIFILFKFAFTYADNDKLFFLLKPTDKLVGILTGTSSVYIPNNGYFHNHLNILIDKSCSGFNFWMLSFLMLCFLGLKNYDNKLYKIFIIPVTLVGSFFITIFVNTSRIFASVIIENKTKYYIDNQHIIHEAIGIVTYLSFLILVYFLSNKLFTKKIYDAKFT